MGAVPISASELFRDVGLSCAGRTRWGDEVPTDDPGVYVVTLSDDPERNAGLLPQAPITVSLVRQWIERVPTFKFDGVLRPDPKEVAAFIARFWLPDESIVYVGKGK